VGGGFGLEAIGSGSFESKMIAYRSPRKTVAAWKAWAGRLKLEVYTLYLACKDPRVPRRARVLAACIVAYAFSPIDLIPDFIPVLGYVDDLILLPLGIWVALKMIPPPVLMECRGRAREITERGGPVSRKAGVVIVMLWVLLAAIAIAFFFSRLRPEWTGDTLSQGKRIW
jgi:uncharacterized membrane protein YkvA (DUF1232 family)